MVDLVYLLTIYTVVFLSYNKIWNVHWDIPVKSNKGYIKKKIKKKLTKTSQEKNKKSQGLVNYREQNVKGTPPSQNKKHVKSYIETSTFVETNKIANKSK